QPLEPTTEECFKRSLEHAPDQLETHQALFCFLQQRRKDGAAEKAARNLLQRFPEHVPTLIALGDRCRARAKYAEALDYYRQALRANPLDRRLRDKVGVAHQLQARALGESGDFEAARAEYQTAVAFQEGKQDWNLLCKWAALEFKADNPARAE